MFLIKAYLDLKISPIWFKLQSPPHQRSSFSWVLDTYHFFKVPAETGTKSISLKTILKLQTSHCLPGKNIKNMFQLGWCLDTVSLKPKCSQPDSFTEEWSCLCPLCCAMTQCQDPVASLGRESQILYEQSDMSFKHDSGPTYIRGKYFSTSILLAPVGQNQSTEDIKVLPKMQKQSQRKHILLRKMNKYYPGR